VAVRPSPQVVGDEPKRPLWPLLLFGALFALFVSIYYLRNPLPFFGYFSDPEIAYIFSALQLKDFGYVQMTDHPGTFLQLVGAGLASLLGFDFSEAFDASSYQKFRSAWLWFSVLTASSAVYLLWRKIGSSVCVFFAAVLLLFHDYNTLMQLGRFTPEGGFFALYLLVLVLAAGAAGRARKLNLFEAIGWGALLGAVTTIKITLWPVSAFLIGAFLCLRLELKSRTQLFAWGAMLCVAVLAYQIKYLLPQTYLLIAYCLLCFRHFKAEMPSLRIVRCFTLILALVAVNGFVNFHIVHRYNLSRYAQIESEVDRILMNHPASHYYFSLEVPHANTAYGIGVREISDLLLVFKKSHLPLTVFRERNSDYSISMGKELPLEEIKQNSLIFTQRYFKDARVELLFYNETFGLFAYLSPRL